MFELKVGAHFIWQPRNPRAWAHVIVTRIDTHDSKGIRFDERRIWVKRADGRPISRIPDTFEAWNEEGYFREVCVPCTERGVEIVPRGTT